MGKLPLTLPLMAAMMGLNGFGKPDQLEGVDLEKEYELIKQKKSKLPASQRRAIVFRMEGK